MYYRPDGLTIRRTIENRAGESLRRGPRHSAGGEDALCGGIDLAEGGGAGIQSSDGGGLRGDAGVHSGPSEPAGMLAAAVVSGSEDARAPLESFAKVSRNQRNERPAACVTPMTCQRPGIAWQKVWTRP